MFMPKKGISVTLSDGNLLWLKARTQAAKARSLSETLDNLVTEARLAGQIPQALVRSVVGTVDVAADDPNLERADAYIRDLFSSSTARPVLARGGRARYAAPRGRRRG
jgi:hypothetical protein